MFQINTPASAALESSYTPFGERGGLGKAHQLFGEQLPQPVWRESIWRSAG